MIINDSRQGFGSSQDEGGILLEHNVNVDERRRFRRFHCAQPVQFQFKDPRQFGGSLSCDLSEGGVRLRLNDFIPLNTELTLSIQLTDKSTVECPCRVAWVEKNRFDDHYKAGLEFVEADSLLESRKKVHGFLSPKE